MNILILLPHPFELWNAPAWFSERLRSDFPGIEVVQRNTYEDAERYLAQADILMAWSLRPQQFHAAKKLRWIHSPAAAVHGLLLPEVVASQVVITNGARVNGPVVAEHALALVLALSKRLDLAARAQARHAWAQQALWEARPRPREIAGAVLGLLGVGNIGGEIARRAAALGMRVLGVREHPERGLDWLAKSPSAVNGAPQTATAENLSSAGHAVVGPSGLDDVIAACDYLLLAAPLTSSTRHIIDARRLALLKPEACIVNVSRGALVEEPALIDALVKGRIGGAALDVFAAEPLPPDSPLWELENVIITPHSAAISVRLWDRQYALFSENLRRFLSGRPLLAQVDKLKGY